MLVTITLKYAHDVFNVCQQGIFVSMNAGKSVAFYTLGCKLNFSETSTIGRSMEEHGFRVVDFDTCSTIHRSHYVTYVFCYRN